MHEQESAAPFFIPFLPSSPHERENRWEDTERPSVMFALAGKRACVCTQHDSPGPRSSLLCGAPRGPRVHHPRWQHRLSAYTSLQTERGSNCCSRCAFCSLLTAYVILAAEMSQVSDIQRLIVCVHEAGNQLKPIQTPVSVDENYGHHRHGLVQTKNNYL